MVQSDALKNSFYQQRHLLLIVRIGAVDHSVGYDSAHRHRAVSHQSGQSLQSVGFHFVIGDFMPVEPEFLYMGVQIGIGQRQTQFAALRAIESHCRNSIAANHIVAAYLLYQLLVSVDHVRLCPKRIPAHIIAECMLELEIRNLVSARIIVQHAIEPDCFLCYYRRPEVTFRLQCP